MNKLGIKVVSIIAIILLTLVLVQVAFDLINQPSTAAVIGGVMILLGIILYYIGTVPRIINWFRTNSQVPKKEEGDVKKNMTGTTGLLLIALIALPIMTGCSRVGPGHVGIKISMAGDTRGVEEIPLTTGWVFFNPALSKVYEYPTYVQTAVWTRDNTEGSPNNEEISFNSKEGLIITGDISLSYQLTAAKVPHFFVKFRSDDLNTFTHGFMRNVARDLFNEVGGKYSVEEIYGPKKEEFLSEVRVRINKQMNEYGINIEQFGFIGAPRPPESVIEALNAKVAATQNAMRAENELRQAEAEAKKAVAKADGEAQANRILAQSITPQLVQWRNLAITEKAIEKWNGARPLVESNSSGMLLQLPLPAATPFPVTRTANAVEPVAQPDNQVAKAEAPDKEGGLFSRKNKKK